MATMASAASPILLSAMCTGLMELRDRGTRMVSAQLKSMRWHLDLTLPNETSTPCGHPALLMHPRILPAAAAHHLTCLDFYYALSGHPSS
jgi:hypothetical protein